jgi:hypothetical protein
MQFAHFLFILREAVAIPMAVKIMILFGCPADSFRLSGLGRALAERSAKLEVL